MDRTPIHNALDALLDLLEPRVAAHADELVRLADVPLEAKARARLVREGKLPAVKIGRELYTRRSAVVGLVDVLPSAQASPVVEDELAEAARRRAARRASR